MAFLETGGFVGLLVPGETVVIAGGVVRRTGPHRRTHPVRADVDLRAWRRCQRLRARSPAWTPIPARARCSCARHRGPARPGGGVLRSLRSGDDSDWPICRAGPAGRAVPCWGVSIPVRPVRRGCLVGTGLWSGAFVGLGYLFWQSFDEAVAIAKQGTLAVGAIALLLAGAIFASRLVRNRRAGPRDRQRVATPRRWWPGPKASADRVVLTMLAHLLTAFALVPADGFFVAGESALPYAPSTAARSRVALSLRRGGQADSAGR